MKALDIFIKTYGLDHPKVATIWNNLGLVWYSLGKHEKAIEYYEKALKSDLKTYGPDHLDVAIDWNNMGTAWKALGKYDKAIEYNGKALKVFEKSLGKDHPNTKGVKRNLEEARRMQKK